MCTIPIGVPSSAAVSEVEDDDDDERWDPVLTERWEFLREAMWEGDVLRIPDPDHPRVRVAERYDMIEWLGTGGWGAVFLAHDTQLDRPVAFKLMRRDDDIAEQTLRQEARCQAKLDHPNVVRLYDIGRSEWGLYVTMEYVEGVDGHTWIYGAQYDWPQAIDVFVQAGRGLAAAHVAGIEHGDFKPANVLIRRDGLVLIADFGIARAMHQPVLEEESRYLGTPSYMPPERFDGVESDPRSDQFSFCASVWECVYGCLPFKGETIDALVGAVLIGHARVEAPLPRLPQRLQKLLRRGLSAVMKERWPSMGVLVSELESLPELPRKRRRWMLSSVALLAALGLGALLAIWLGVARSGQAITLSPAEAIASADAPEPDEQPSIDDLKELASTGDPVELWPRVRALDERGGLKVDELLMLAEILKQRAAASSGDVRDAAALMGRRVASRAWSKAARFGLDVEKQQATTLILYFRSLSRGSSPSHPR